MVVQVIAQMVFDVQVRLFCLLTGIFEGVLREIETDDSAYTLFFQALGVKSGTAAKVDGC